MWFNKHSAPFSVVRKSLKKSFSLQVTKIEANLNEAQKEFLVSSKKKREKMKEAGQV